MYERRQLSFANLDEVMPEVERLSAGYELAGRWTLGQICKHLAMAFHIIIEGPPGFALSSEPEDPRYGRIRQRFFRMDRFPDGVEAPLSKLVPDAGLDEDAEVQALRGALARFQGAPGPFFPHPFLGSMTKEEWTRFQCLHAAHHLGFVVPRMPA
jgi:hypothetical protein